MAISPQLFFRFGAEYANLLMALFERGSVDASELLTLIERNRTDTQASPDYIRHQLEALEFLEPAAHADEALELTQPVRDLLAWLTRQQRYSSARVLEGYLNELAGIGDELDHAIRAGDMSRAALALGELSGTIERIRTLSQANRESIISETQSLRAQTQAQLSAFSAVDRFATVRRLWEHHLLPLRDLVSVHGEMERRLDSLQTIMAAGEQKFIAHGMMHAAFTQTAARLARMRRTTAEDHLISVQEVAPLYERMRRDSSWLRGASLALAHIRQHRPNNLNISQFMGITGWRPHNLFNDEELLARFELLSNDTPQPPTPIALASPPPKLPIIQDDELARALAEAVPIQDVLAFILGRWPDRPLTAQLRAYGLVCRGIFGTPILAEAAVKTRYPLVELTLHAWPLTLTEVVR